MTCRHQSRLYMVEGIGDGLYRHHLECTCCGTWLPLGHSDETDERVALEIRAAEIAADHDDGRIPKCLDQPFEQNCERCGFEDWGGHVECTNKWHAGYLARCITSHGGES